MKTIIGRKIGMTQIFDASGKVLPVTVIKAGPCKVVQIKTKEKDGYNALVVAFEEVKEKKLNKPLKGIFKKAGVAPHRFLREIKVEDVSSYKVGDEVKVDIFENVSYVDVTGYSKGRGFAGVYKRHGFGGTKDSHGTHEYFRHPGSIGASSDPSRVFKGKKMPGRMGGEKVTVQNLELVRIDKENNLLLVKGAVPGAVNGLVVVKKAVKKS